MSISGAIASSSAGPRAPRRPSQGVPRDLGMADKERRKQLEKRKKSTDVGSAPRKDSTTAGTGGSPKTTSSSGKSSCLIMVTIATMGAILSVMGSHLGPVG